VGRHPGTLDGSVNVVPMLVLAFLGAQVSGYTQQPSGEQPPRFGVEVNFVEVDALVVDADGNFVSNLSQEDFEVLEDGIPQEIATFRVVDIPVAPVPVAVERAPFVLPDVSTNEAPEEGRLFVLVLDDLHTDPSRSNVVRRVAREFVEKWIIERPFPSSPNGAPRTCRSQKCCSMPATSRGPVW